jgi:hypothetical protein
MTSALVLLMVATAGCRHDGRTLRPARPDQTSSISTTTLPPTLDGGSSTDFTGSTDAPGSTGLDTTAPSTSGPSTTGG